MADKENQKQEKPKKTNKRWEKYKVSGDKIERTNQSCPKCGPGFFLAKHGNRKTCGKCGYSILEKKE